MDARWGEEQWGPKIGQETQLNTKWKGDERISELDWAETVVPPWSNFKWKWSAGLAELYL